MRLIGINGFKESGKDTTFELIKEAVNMRPGGNPGFRRTVVRAGFADKLKIMAAKALGFVDPTYFPDEECIRIMNDFKEGGFIRVHLSNGNTTSLTGREYLQWFGGEARGVFGDTFWIDQVLPAFPQPGNRALHRMELEAKYPGVNTLVITDVRYSNEAERVKELDGEVWEIVRPGLESDGHASERPLPRELVDLTIINDGSIEDLHRKVEAAL